MPACGEYDTPHFAATNPCELHCFFAELRFLFSRLHISGDAEKKYHALRYVDYDSADLWELLPEFSDPMHTFMDTLVTDAACTSIASLMELGCYYHNFLSITSFLIAKNRLSTGEQS